MQEKAIRQYRILVRGDEEVLRQCSAVVNWQMDISSDKGWRTEEKISILLQSELSSSIPVSSSNLRRFRKYNQSCITRQCTVTRRFYRVFHVGHGKRIEVNSESWFWFHDESVSEQVDKLCFFTDVNPMDNQDDLGKSLNDLSQVRIASYKNTWKHFQDTVFWCNLKLAQQRGLQFFQTRANAVILNDTLSAEFIEKAICMKIKDHLYQRKSVILISRVVLKVNS